MWNIPNSLTIARVVAIPIVIALYLIDQKGVCLFVLVAALLTDFFDGKLARALNQETLLGAILDPIADKFVVISLWSFVGFYLHRAPLFLVYIYLARNIAQLLAIPILSWWLKKPFKVKPKWYPKAAGALCFALLPIYFADSGPEATSTLNPVTEFMGHMLSAGIYLSILLEVYILFTYVPRLIAIATNRHDTFE